MLTLDPKSLSTSKLHSYLLSAVAPRPIAFASTIAANGQVNLAPFSFFNVFSANPPIVVFSPLLREKNNLEKHTLKNIKATKEVVINVVNFDMVHQTSLSSANYPEGVNEFEKAGLTMLKSDVVKPFRVAESPVQLECKVNEIIALGTEGGAGSLVICEVLKIHIDDDVLNDDGSINQQKLDLVARAGGNYYSRVKKGFFEIQKPASNLGIGVADFPEEIKNSMVLTGNDLGMLGTVEKLPNQNEVNAFIKDISERYPNIKTASQREKHKLARNYLSFGAIESAWKLLLS